MAVFIDSTSLLYYIFIFYIQNEFQVCGIVHTHTHTDQPIVMCLQHCISNQSEHVI